MSNDIKGVILAGGTGSRLYPLTKVTNKHCLAVGKKPMIYYAIEKMIEAGIKSIMIVTGIEHIGSLVGLLGSGKEFNCDFTYRVQDEAGGIAQALYLAKDFVGQSKSLVILGDNIFEASLKEAVDSFKEQASGATLFLTEVEDPERFGVPTLEDGKIQKITEKPSKPDSNYAVTGIYLYDDKVFDYIEQCAPSNRGELEITDVNNHYIQNNQCYSQDLSGWWTDAGTFSSLEKASKLVS